MKKVFIPLMVLGITGALTLSACGKSETDRMIDAAPAAKISAPTSAALKTDGLKLVAVDAAKSKLDWLGAKVTSKHDGGFKKFDGKAWFDAKGDLKALRLEIDMSSLWSDSEKLTGHLLSKDFFFVKSHPKTTLVANKITKGADGSYTVAGDLTLRGVTKGISFPLTVKKEGDVQVATANFSINRFDFKIVYPGKPDNLIRKEVLLKIRLVAAK